MSFAAVSIVNPPWMQEISRPGKEVESRDAKEIGDNLMRDGQFRKAASQYLHALKIRPDYAGAMSNLGVALKRLKDPVQAENWLRKALTYPDADRGMAHFHLAELQAERGRFEDAHQHLQSALEAGFDASAVWRRRAEAYIAEERWEDAKLAFIEALRSDRDVTTVYRTMLYRDLEFAKADSIARGVTQDQMTGYDLTFMRYQQQHDPEVSRTCNDLGIMYLNTGDTLRAMQLMQEAVTIHPRNDQAQRNLKLLQQVWKPR